MTAVWTYASTGGERYPVEPGQLWSAGRHFLACGDLQKGDARRLMTRLSVTPDVVYTDPPWNASNAGAFRTKAGVPSRVAFRLFLKDVVSTVSLVRRYAFIEMGVHEADALADIIIDAGGDILHRWMITYYRVKPAVLFCATWTKQPALDCDLTGLNDTVTPMYALEAVRTKGTAETVLDCCSGRGLTARSAHGLGYDFIGLELSRWRMSAALHSLTQFGCNIRLEGKL